MFFLFHMIQKGCKKRLQRLMIKLQIFCQGVQIDLLHDKCLPAKQQKTPTVRLKIYIIMNNMKQKIM